MPHFVAFFVPRFVVYTSSQDFVETRKRPASPVPFSGNHRQAVLTLTLFGLVFAFALQGAP